MSKPVIALIGGTGPQGKGLAYRFARGGHDVIIGSRSAQRAAATAVEIGAMAKVVGAVTGAGNVDAAAAADVVILAVPYAGHSELLTELRDVLNGKVVVSCVNPLGFDKSGPFGLDVPQGSAAEQAAELLPGARLVAAFHHVSAVNLIDPDGDLSHEDVLVVGDDTDAKATVCELARTVSGRPGVDSGALRLAGQLEAFTAVLISINKRYKIRSGVAIAGLSHVAGGGE